MRGGLGRGLLGSYKIKHSSFVLMGGVAVVTIVVEAVVMIVLRAVVMVLVMRGPACEIK
jgi:hypothetical protein